MSLPLGLALQKALFQRLSSACSVPVYDAVPDNTPYPYITLDSEFLKNGDMVSGERFDNRLLYLSVWSDYKGQAEVKGILEEIRTAVQSPLTLETGQAPLLRLLDARCQRDADGVTYMGSATLQITTTL